MRSILLISILAVATATVVKVDLINFESRRVRLWKEGKWQIYLQEKEHRLSRMKSVLYRDHFQWINDFDDLEYGANITIGTPHNQQFLVVMDTGSSNLWIPDSDCTADDCKTKNRYNASASSTYKKDGRMWEVGYGDGSNANGILGSDVVGLGGTGDKAIFIKDQIFGQASYMDGFGNDPVDGILGCAFLALADQLVTPPLINAISQGLFDKPLFTVWMEHIGSKNNERGGAFTYGDIDDENCGSIMAYQPLSSVTYWQFHMNSIGTGNYSNSNGWEVISDTGTSFIGGVDDVITAIATELGGQYNDVWQSYMVNCSAQILPISIKIGTVNYTIQEINMIVNMGDDACVLAIFSMGFGGFGPTWILGDPFIRQYCQIYDIGGQRIGFAPSLQK